MQQRSVLIVSALIGLCAISVVDSSTHGLMPPLFRDSEGLSRFENPNARMQNREDVNYRLPNDTLPQHYTIVLTTNVHEGKTEFSGAVNIDLVVVAATTQIVMHAREIKILSANLKNKINSVSETIPWEYEAEREFLTFTRTTAMAKDSEWELTITYEGVLRDDNGGFYISSYTAENGETKYLATTQFESTDARHAFPCYDEPAKRAIFTITINHSPTYNAISNMPVNTALSSPGKTVFETSINMPTYVVAFIVSDFKYTEGVLGGVPNRIYSRPGTEQDQEWALVSGMSILERLSEYYGIDYHLPKLDQAAIPDFAAGAMENWGLATYREEYMLYNKENSTVNTQTNIAQIIAHELCHQWFGNYVAIKWWTYLWLKEGFATLFAFKASDAAYPEWGVWQQFHTDEYLRAMSSDSSANPRPLTHYVEQPKEISSLYDGISYSKGGSVLRMFNHALTDVVFRQGLHNYLSNNKFSAAEEDDLFSAIATAAVEENYPVPATISEMMKSWTNQGGLPLLTVTRDYATGKLKISQKPYISDGSENTEKLWYIPFNYATAGNSDYRDTEATHYLLKEREIEIEIPNLKEGDWLILNKQSTGYYRINYDLKNWNLIIAALYARPQKFHPLNRAQFISDAYSASTINALPHANLLSLMTYLEKEDQYAPWSGASSVLTTFNRFLSGDAQYKEFQFYVRTLVSDIYEIIGLNDIPGEQHYQKYTRNIIINLACMAEIADCLKETNQKLIDLVEENKALEPNTQSQVYCNGLKQSEDSVFQYVFTKLMDSDDQALRRTLISSLGCAQKAEQLKQFVESATDYDNKLRTQERSTILGSAYSRGNAGLNAALDYLDDNWEEYASVNAGFGNSNPLEDAIRGISSYTVTDQQEKRVLDLLEKVKNSDKINDFERLESSVKNNIAGNFAWLKKNRDPLMTWLSNYQKAEDDDNSAHSISLSVVTIATAVFLAVSRLF